MTLVLLILLGLASPMPKPDSLPNSTPVVIESQITQPIPLAPSALDIKLPHRLELNMVNMDWEKLPEGCHYTGNSACGGSDRYKCAKNQRYFTWECTVFGKVYQNAGCKIDTAC